MVRAKNEGQLLSTSFQLVTSHGVWDRQTIIKSVMSHGYEQFDMPNWDLVKSIDCKATPHISLDNSCSSLFGIDWSFNTADCFLTQRWCFTSFMFKKMFPGVSTCDYSKVPQSISFSGSGFMATYQLGVAQCFVNYAPWLLRTAPCVLGASAGSLVAAAVVCEVSLSKWITWFICVRGVLKSLKPFLTFLNLPMPLWMWCA